MKQCYEKGQAGFIRRVKRENKEKKCSLYIFPNCSGADKLKHLIFPWQTPGKYEHKCQSAFAL